jgi:hypothetical protein
MDRDRFGDLSAFSARSATEPRAGWTARIVARGCRGAGRLDATGADRVGCAPVHMNPFVAEPVGTMPVIGPIIGGVVGARVCVAVWTA